MSRTIPKLEESVVKSILKTNGAPASEVSILAIRGYYLNAGKPGVNDRGRYDDAMFVSGPNLFASFRANTDPSSYRRGKGTGSGKGMASLLPGRWKFNIGQHRGRNAFRQASPMVVLRDGSPNYLDFGWFAINLHNGGNNTTSSAGCQTLAPEEWSLFQPMMYTLLKNHNPRIKNDWDQTAPGFHYILLDELARRAGRLSVPTYAEIKKNPSDYLTS